MENFGYTVCLIIFFVCFFYESNSAPQMIDWDNINRRYDDFMNTSVARTISIMDCIRKVQTEARKACPSVMKCMRMVTSRKRIQELAARYRDCVHFNTSSSIHLLEGFVLDPNSVSSTAESFVKAFSSTTGLPSYPSSVRDVTNDLLMMCPDEETRASCLSNLINDPVYIGRLGVATFRSLIHAFTGNGSGSSVSQDNTTG